MSSRWVRTERLLGAGFVIDTEDTHVRLSEGSPGRSRRPGRNSSAQGAHLQFAFERNSNASIWRSASRLLAPGVQTHGRGSASRRNSGAGQAIAAWKPALRGGHARSSCKRKAMITAAASAARLAMANDQPGPSPDQAYPAYNAPARRRFRTGWHTAPAPDPAGDGRSCAGRNGWPPHGSCRRSPRASAARSAVRRDDRPVARAVASAAPRSGSSPGAPGAARNAQQTRHDQKQQNLRDDAQRPHQTDKAAAVAERFQVDAEEGVVRAVSQLHQGHATVEGQYAGAPQLGEKAALPGRLGAGAAARSGPRHCSARCPASPQRQRSDRSRLSRWNSSPSPTTARMKPMLPHNRTWL